MSVVYESQVFAQCDDCSASMLTSVMKVEEFKRYLRSKGWRIGKVCLCPICANENAKGVSSQS